VADKDIESVQARIEEISKKHIRELELLGMRVNESKTEIVVFDRKGFREIDFKIGQSTIKSQRTMKALGVILDNNMSWNNHINYAIMSSAWKLSVLRKIRKDFNKQQFKNIMTMQFFSKLYYASQVWLTLNTSRKQYDIINSIHYRGVRLIACDFKGIINREKLDLLTSRAPPKQWAKYSVAAITMKILRNGSPKALLNSLQETLYVEQRSPHLGRFYDKSKGKIGKQKLGNCLQFMSAIKTNWYGLQLSDNRIRTILKNAYFAYYPYVNHALNY
jgi:hypothetical protein